MAGAASPVAASTATRDSAFVVRAFVGLVVAVVAAGNAHVQSGRSYSALGSLCTDETEKLPCTLIGGLAGALACGVVVETLLAAE